MKIKIPVWLWIVIVLETLPMFFGPYLALTRPAVMGGPEAETINQAAYMYAARNFAVGFAFLIASYLRSAPMLFILVFVYLTSPTATHALVKAAYSHGIVASTDGDEEAPRPGAGEAA